MAQIDPTARIEDGAKLGAGVSIGPFCHVGPDVILEDGCCLVSHVQLTGHTTVGPRTVVHPFACLGGPPQALAYRGEPTSLVIGADCTIRESVTMNRGTAQGGGETTVGDGGFFMAYSHVAHDCHVGREAIFANCATLAGHCVIGDGVFISGLVSVHQFSRIGSGAMVAGGSTIRGDVIPFGLAVGAQARLVGINTIGMRRRKHSLAAVRAVRKAYRMVFFASGPLADRIAAAKSELGHVPEVAEVVEFLVAARNRPLCQPRSGKRGDEPLPSA